MNNGSNGKIDFAAQRKRVAVYVAELDHTFYLQTVSVGQFKTELQRDMSDASRQLACAIVDENGNRLYTTEEDIANLDCMSLTVMRQLIDALNKLHGISTADVEQTSKNFEASPITDFVS